MSAREDGARMGAGIAVRVARPLVAWLAMQGRDAAQILAAAGFPRGVMQDPDARVPEDAWRALWAGAEAVEPDAGLLAGEFAASVLRSGRPPPEHVAVALLASAPTVGDGLAHLGAVQGLSVPDVSYRVCAEPTGWRTVRLEAEGPRALLEFLLTWPILAIPALAAPRIGSWEVELPFPAPADTTHHRRLLGPGVRFGASVGSFRVGATDWSAPMRAPDPETYARLLHLAAEASPGIADRVRALLAAGPLPLAEEAARRLGVSPRSLRRSLLDEGTSYRDLVDDARRIRAEAALESGLDLAETARALGYSDVRALRRALRRWDPADG